MHIRYWWENHKKKQLGRPRSRWVDNNKLDFGEVGLDDMDWIHLNRITEFWDFFHRLVF
jgi:hypothetical protein